jgi:hypothetical protein
MKILPKKSAYDRNLHFFVSNYSDNSKHRNRPGTILYLNNNICTLLLGLPLRIEERFHAAVVETVRLHQIDNHKLIFDIFSCVSH